MQKPDMAGLMEFLKPLNEVISKASSLTEGRRSDFPHHLKTGADSLAALAWIAYTGKDCGKKYISSTIHFVVNFFSLSSKTVTNMLSFCRYEHAYSTRGRKLANG